MRTALTESCFVYVLLFSFVSLTLFPVFLFADDSSQEKTGLNFDQLFEAEKTILTNFFSEQEKNVTQTFSAFRDEFEDISDQSWEIWRGDGSEEITVKAENGFLTVKHPEAAHHIIGGLRTREPVVAVPRISRSHFKLSFDMDTLHSNGGTFLIRPDKSETVIGHSEIRLSFTKDFKTGCFSLYIDNVDAGKFMVPLVESYEVSVYIGFDGISVYGKGGEKHIDVALPSWASKGTSHYLTLGLFTSSVDGGEYLLNVNSVVLSYPRRMSVACPVYRCGHSLSVLDDSFSTISDSVWNHWTEGNDSQNVVKATDDGLSCSLEKTGKRGNPWGRMGLISRKPLVAVSDRDGSFSVINFVIDSTFTSGARIALVDKPVDMIWGSPHIRFGMERRGYYCQGWIGHEADLEAMFDFPLSDECEFSLIVGKYGVYMLDPGCQLVGSFKRPKWCSESKGLYLVLYGQASRPGESVSFLYRSIEVTSEWCPDLGESPVPIRKSSSPVKSSVRQH